MLGRDGQAGAGAASFPRTPKEEDSSSGPSSPGLHPVPAAGGGRMQPPQALALPSLPVLTLPNKAPALPISLRPSLLPWERPQHPGLLCSLRAMAILGCETLHQLGSFSEHFINIPAVGARPPPTLLTSAHKQQLPITLLRAEIHARLHPDVLPRSSAGAGLVWTASQPQTLPRAHKHPTVTHIGTTPSS